MAVIRTSNVDLKINGDDAYAYVAQPDDDARYPGVVLIQEWWGVEPHVRDLAQKLATEGFVAAVPDLYHGKVATEPNDAMKMVMTLTENVDRVSKEITGALEVLRAMPSVDPKKLGLVGFCVGGFLAWTVATRYNHLAALAIFYPGSYNPTPEEVAKINVPVLAVFGSHDRNTPPPLIKKIERLHKEAGKDITVKVYEAGHAFLNPDHGMGNKEAAADAWPLAVNFLRKHVQ